MTIRSHDLTAARTYLADDPTAKVVAVKDGVLIGIQRGDGLRPLLSLIESARMAIHGASVADRVIGEAAAVLLIEAQVSAVHGEVMSIDAHQRLLRHSVRASFDERVAYIMRRGISTAVDSNTDRCIMEQLVMDVDDTREAANRLRQKLLHAHK